MICRCPKSLRLRLLFAERFDRRMVALARSGPDPRHCCVTSDIGVDGNVDIPGPGLPHPTQTGRGLITQCRLHGTHGGRRALPPRIRAKSLMQPSWGSPGISGVLARLWPKEISMYRFTSPCPRPTQALVRVASATTTVTSWLPRNVFGGNRR